MTRIAVYPGSFDPITRGHEDIIRRTLHFADRVIVAIAENSTKTPLFTLKERMAMLERVLAGDQRIEVRSFSGLLADFARAAKADLVIRGVRAVSDFEYEFQMAYMNRQLWDGLETAFLVPALDLAFLSSSLVREVSRLGGNVSEFVHPEVHKALKAKFSK